MIPVNIQVHQTDVLVHGPIQTWTVRPLAVGPVAIHHVAHRAGIAQGHALHTTIAIPAQAVVRSLDLAEDRVHHRALALDMVTLATIAQTNYALNPVDAPVRLQALARAQIPATMTPEMTCTPLAKNPEAHLLALTTDAHVATAGARAVADEMTLMK